MRTPQIVTVSLGFIAVAAGAIWTIRNRKLFLVSEVATGESFDYPDLRTHVYFAQIPAVATAARTAIESLPKWRLVFHDESANKLYSEVESQIGGFLSDLTVALSPLGPRHTRVSIRSRSRVGRGDLGENARFIRLLQSAMDSSLIGG